MDINFIPKSFDYLKEENLCFIYNGVFSDQITDMIIQLSDVNIKKYGEMTKMRKKVSFLLAECFQNVLRHGEIPEKKECVPQDPYFFVMRNIKDAYFISSGNLIENEAIPELKTKLEKVNELDNTQLKQFYMDVLENESMTKKGGAGLGLIEMARKSGQKLIFDFQPHNKNYSFFFLQVSMVGKSQESSPPPEPPISDIQGFYKIMKEYNIFMIHKDHFTQAAIRPTIKMMEDCFKSLKIKRWRSKFHVMVEMLQNTSKHGYKKEAGSDGIFLSGIDDGSVFISSGNYIANTKVEKLENYIDNLNEMPKEELELLYLNKMRTGELTKGGNAGLGLIDILRACGSIQYKINEINKEKSFVSIFARF